METGLYGPTGNYAIRHAVLVCKCEPVSVIIPPDPSEALFVQGLLKMSRSVTIRPAQFMETGHPGQSGGPVRQHAD